MSDKERYIDGPAEIHITGTGDNHLHFHLPRGQHATLVSGIAGVELWIGDQHILRLKPTMSKAEFEQEQEEIANEVPCPPIRRGTP